MEAVRNWMNGRLQRGSAAGKNRFAAASEAYLQGIKRLGLNLHGFMLIQNGKVMAEWHDPEQGAEIPHELFSACKSMVSLAVGIAVEEKKLSLTDAVIDFFPEKLPAQISESLRRLTVRDLLTMSSGQAGETWGKLKAAPDGDWVRAFLELEPVYMPGEQFVYSNSNSYILSAIIHKLYGKPLVDFLYERVFDELGLRRWEWSSCPRGISQGTHGWRITIEDAALIAQLLLQKGSWNGKQLVPAGWLDEATKKQIKTDAVFTWADRVLGYGYHFWPGQNESFRCEGAYGQEILIFPEENAAFVSFAGMRFGQEMQENLNLVWQLFYPRLKDGEVQSSSEGSGAYAVPENIYGISGIEFTSPDTAVFTLTGQPPALVSTEQPADTVLVFRGQAEPTRLELRKIAPGFYEAHFCMIHSAYRLTLLMLTEGKQIRLVPLVKPEWEADEAKPCILAAARNT